MKRNKLWNRALALLCAAALTVIAIPEVWAAGTDPTLTVSNITVSQGGTGYVDVYGANLENLAVLEFSLTYDPDVLSVNSVNTYAMDSTSVNKDTPGSISFKGMHVAGVSGTSVRFMRVSFRVASDAEPGPYPIGLTVGIAKDTTMADVVFTKQAGSVTVTKAQPSQATFYSELLADSVEVGDQVTYQLKASNPAGMAAGQFSFTYDSDRLEFQEAKLLSGLQTEDYEYSVNHNNPGLVVVAWVSKSPATSGPLLELTFRATNTGNVTITCTPGTLIDTENNSITAAATSKTVTITQKEEEETLPAFRLELPEKAQTNEPFTLTAVVDGSSGLGAADFTVNYDADVLVCQSVTKADSAEEGVAVVINPNDSGGVIKFSMMCSAGIARDTELVQMTFRAKNNSAATTELKTAVSDAVDATLNTVALEALPAQLSIVVPDFTVTFRDHDETVLKTQTVPYLGAAEAPTPGGKGPDENWHYVFEAWDQSFDQVTEDLVVTARYTAAAHTFGGWTKDDGDTHTGTCTGCSMTKTCSHTWGTDTPADMTNHVRCCPDCGAESLRPHEWENSVCTVCGQEDVVLTSDGKTITLQTALPAGTNCMVAAYDSAGKMLSVDQYVWEGQDALSIPVPAGDRVQVFFLDEQWNPLRGQKSI